MDLVSCPFGIIEYKNQMIKSGAIAPEPPGTGAVYHALGGRLRGEARFMG